MAICAQCGERNRDGARFCDACGAPIAAAAPARREERKIVSVLFADLVGFTARAEQLDPEDVRALLAPYHDRLRQLLERHGGTVEKFIGDAVMALFGAPVAHEDDPERAVRAALAIRDELREDGGGLQVRIGVNTGEALVTVDARAAEGEGMAAGDVVNTAARIQAAASVNAVLVGERTHRATRHAIEYRAAAPVVAKGKADPVAVWEALEPRSRFGVDLGQSATVPLVGRQRELELLTSTLARVREEQTAQLVTLVGVPGVGKSRLVGELFSLLDEDAGVLTWRQGRSLPYGEPVTFWALGEIVKAHAGILENDSDAEAEAKLAEATAVLAADEAERAWLAADLRPLVGLEDGGSGRRSDGRFAAWRRFLELLAEQRPLVLVLEDLHWADDELLDFVDGLVDEVADVPMLVLATTRPELLDRRPGWGGGKPNAATVSLAPLTEAASEQLVAELLEQAGLPVAGHAQLLAQAGGNPLYAEQYVRALAERGDAAGLPETIHGVIAARLDGLEPHEKAALQDAATIGKVFWTGAVAAIGGGDRDELAPTLRRLERMQFVQRARRSSLAGEDEYAFRHALIRDVAYGQVPRARRGALHLATAGWLETVGRPDDLAETLAHHYSLVLEHLPGEAVDPALVSAARAALRDAGERALALCGYQPAARYFDAAARLPADGDAERARLLLGLGRARFGADGSGDPELEQALALARSQGDLELAAEAALSLRVNAWYRGEGETSEAWLASALDLVRDRPDSRAKAHALAELFRSNTATGRHEETMRLAPDALALAERVGPEAVRARILSAIGTSRAYLGDPAGMDDLRRSIEIARAAGALEQVHAGMNNLSGCELLFGNLPQAVRTYEELAASVERVGREVDRRWVEISLAALWMAAGRWDAAMEQVDAFLAVSEAGSPHYVDGTAYLTRATIRAARDDLAGARADADRSLARARDIDLQVLAAALAGRAAVLLEAGERDEAGAMMDELLSRPSAGRVLEYAVVDAAWTARDLGRTGALRAMLADAHPTPWIGVAAAIADGDAAGAAGTLAGLHYPFGEAYARLRAAERMAVDAPAGALAQLDAAAAIFADLKAARHLRRAEALRRRLPAAPA